MKAQIGAPGLIFLLLATAAAAQDFANPGPYAPGSQTVTVTRPGGGSFQASLFYPATAPGQGQPFAAAAAPAPAITFGHGFLQPVDRYTSTLQHLATWGFIVIASQSESGLFPSHANFAADLRHCLTYLEQQQTTPGSLLEGRVNAGAFGASGHSMGGGASILAASADPRIRALAPLAPADTNPSAITASSALSIPALLIAGTADSIVPTASHGAPMYAAAPPAKMLREIQGGFHCGFQDVSSFGCDSGPLARAEQLAITRRMLTGFFLLYLKGDQSVWRQVWGPERDADPRVGTVANTGITLSPAPVEVEAFGGQTPQATLVVTNTAPDARAYQVGGELPSWSVGPSVPTGLLAGNASANASVGVAMPVGNARQEQDGLVWARSLTDGGTRAWTLLVAVRLCRADLDRSGSLNVADFSAMLTAFAAQNPDADIDADGKLTVADFGAYLQSFAAGCE